MTHPLQEKIINEIIRIEGGYVNNPNDSGGPTKYGITQAVARQNGYYGHMRDLPVSLAYKIYANKYWHPLMLDNVVAESPAIAEELADTGVNMGIGRAGEFLQRALNALNKQGQHYPDLRVDGAVGARTISALVKFLDHRGKDGEIVLLRVLNCLQGAYYVSLAERRQKDEDFMFGWFLNRIK